MKINFYPINQSAEVEAGVNLLQTFLANEIKVRSVCRGRGICATCRVNVKCPVGAVSPKTPQEMKTLALIVGVTPTTRLSYQCRILGDGVMIDLPTGLFIESLQDLLDLIGEEAVADYRHPVNGAVLIPKEKIITQSLLQLFKNLSEEINKVNET